MKDPGYMYIGARVSGVGGGRGMRCFAAQRAPIVHMLRPRARSLWVSCLAPSCSPCLGVTLGSLHGRILVPFPAVIAIPHPGAALGGRGDPQCSHTTLDKRKVPGRGSYLPIISFGGF